MVTAIIVAAGGGTRLGGATPKQYRDLCGKPLLCHSLSVFDDADWVDRLVLVTPKEERLAVIRPIIAANPVKKPLALALGGDHRQGSVFNGLLACDPSTEIVLIHDAARPFVTGDEIRRCVEAARVHGAAVLGHPATDTIKRADGRGFAVETPDRSALWQVQTPQAFLYNLILSAHRKALYDGFVGTDDAALAERAGQKVFLERGSRWNIKITEPIDLEIARAVMEQITQKAARGTSVPG
ncbi:MAG: 2-C-methyl-D-erythritol 4-phosphate cytidylyltransferase [Deltaproteobacteria bacterium]|nr:2-C-methyl-D-erythritol 4-phosphate cytidylyltransferase [Deltaproteobacteria bacterium]